MKIAIFPSAGLGDGIIQLLLAQNLAKLNLNIDFYHHFLSDMNHLIDGINVYKPAKSVLNENLNLYDVILADSGAQAIDLSDFHNLIEEKLATYSMGRVAIYSLNKRRRLHNSVFAVPPLILSGRNIDFKCFNGQTLSPSRYLGLSTADHIVHFLKINDLVDSPNNELSLSLPGHWKRKKHSKRILIHPTSTNENKNWLPKRYIELAFCLKQDGFRPVFSVSPDEKSEWVKRVGGKFEIPCFENFCDLSKYYYESAMLIGNDSGNGHLASALGLPTITLISRRFRRFTWRPNWSQNIVVRPLISRKLIGDHYWKYSLSLRRVLSAFECIRLS